MRIRKGQKSTSRTDAATAAEERLDSKGGFRNLLNVYAGVRIPWLLYLISAGINILNSYLTTTRTGYTAQIAAGELTGRTITFWVLLVICCAAVSFADVTSNIADNQLTAGVRGKLWDKIIRLPISYYDRDPPDRLVSRITSDTSVATQPFSILLGLISMGSLFWMVIEQMAQLNRTMLFYYVICNLVILLYTIATMRLYKKIGYMVNNRMSKLTAFLAERLTNFRLIRSACSEDEEQEEGYRLIDLRYRAALLGVAGSFLNGLGYTLTGCVIIVVSFGIGGILLNRGILSDGSVLLSFYYYGGAITTCLFIIFNDLTTLSGILGRANKFASIFRVESEDILSGDRLEVEDQDITLRDISFRYSQNAPVLRHVDATIPRGKVTAIVGANGTGKSTLLKLIERLYPTDEGALMFGEVDASGVRLKDWRAMFGMVTQETVLFSGTVRDNICYGIERRVSDEELRKAAELANIGALIESLPDGYDTEVGTSGSRFSGGERQRIAIARAIMKNPEYLLLDEATANLDTRTEQDVQEGLNRLMQGRTTVMIAHSLSAIRSADHIIVLQNGTAVGSGPHEELLETCEYYRTFVEVQTARGVQECPR